MTITETPTKACTRCGTVKPFDAFVKDRTRRDGRCSRCRECQVAERQERDAAAYKRAWRAAHPGASAEHARRWREKNPERSKAYFAALRAARAGTDFGRRYYAEHRDQQVEKGRRRRAAHRDAILLKNQRRHAQKRGAAGTCSVEQLQGRRAMFGGQCWMCGDEATTVDHVKPLAAGGSNWPANLRPACQPCNSRKGARWFGVLNLHLFKKETPRAACGW